jgi:hypothetical protein
MVLYGYCRRGCHDVSRVGLDRTGACGAADGNAVAGIRYATATVARRAHPLFSGPARFPFAASSQTHSRRRALNVTFSEMLKWENSTGHRENLLMVGARRVGVAFANNPNSPDQKVLGDGDHGLTFLVMPAKAGIQ